MEEAYKKLSPLLAPVTCFFSAASYRSVALQWRGAAALYALGITALSWLLLSPAIHSSASRQIGDLTNAILAEIPKISVEKGVLSCDAEMPVKISDPRDGKVYLEVDTRIAGDVEGFAPSAFPFALITSDRLIYARDQNETRILKFASVPDFTLNAEGLRGYEKMAKRLFLPLTLVIMIPSFFIFYLCKTLLWCTAALIVASVGSREWKFSSLYRVCILAGTPSLVLATLNNLIPLLPWHVLVSVALTLSYTIFGTLSLPRKTSSHVA
jgi:hypothetical protein